MGGGDGDHNPVVLPRFVHDLLQFISAADHKDQAGSLLGMLAGELRVQSSGSSRDKNCQIPAVHFATSFRR